jgi:ABC-type nitrate/sulfonate/bicarbonate transport system substrate-binding protein
MKRDEFVASVFAGACVGVPSIVRAQTVPLRLNVFGGVDAWPIYVIRDKGLLGRAGFDVTITTTPGSVPQFQHMMAGDADLALTAMDNLIAYDEGQGDPSVPGPFDLAGYLGMASGTNKLVVGPGITSFAQLRGKPFAVDALATGFSFVLRRILEKNGIAPGEYSLDPLGATQRRFDAIAAGQCVGAVVSTPFDLLGQQKYGFHVLASALETLGHYEATIIMARRSWAAAHRPALSAFVRAYRDAVTWLYDPANRTEAMAILVRAADLPADVVAQVTPAILGSPYFTRDGAFDIAGIQTVLELRAAYATPKKALGPPAKYIDTSYL